MEGKDKFKGTIGRLREESTPHWDPPLQAPGGSPNILFIVLDDVGFAQLGCYGSDIATPNMDGMAREGVMYTNFHTTAMCSPTRSCLLTGRNHHSNGMACITEFSTGYPGYNAIIPKENGFLGEMLAPHGYASFALGKWHLTPDEETNMAATKERWPLGRGFERFYGFLGGHSDQFDPNLIYDNHPVAPPKSFEEGYHLTEDLVEKAQEFITDLKNVEPDKPFFMYFAPGAMHAPHQAPAEWIEKYRGKFDQGWEKWREEIYQRQLKNGVIPENTQLPPRPEWIMDWETLSDDQRKVYARFMEVYAGFLEHTDYHIGKLLDFLKQIDQYDNTLVMLVSDNGASSEGGPEGSISEARLFNLVPFTMEENLAELDKLGGPESYCNYPWGWTWAGNAPLKRWKTETHEGGVADPLIVQWPQGIKAKGEKRRQYVHAIDLAPTVLELLGIRPPESIDGHAQKPLEGTSFGYSLDHGEAEDRHPTQYYEMMGCRAIYHRGWKAVAWHNKAVPVPGLEGKPFDDDVWELYHVAEDFSEFEDLADKHPDKLRQLQDLWWAEAGRYDVLPLDDRAMQRLFDPRPKPHEDKSEYVYFPNGAPIGEGVAVNVKNRSHTIAAEAEIPPEGAEGVLLCHGGRFGGYTLFVKDQRLHYAYNFLGMETYRIVSKDTIPSGVVKLEFQFEKDDVGGFGAGGKGTLSINGQKAGEGRIPRTIGVRYHLADDGFCCGYNSQSPVADDYSAPFGFNGKLNRVIITTDGEGYYDPELELKIAISQQ
ncbi:MAG: arylsulfatase [Proteobacteria bacterium]|nr:arylsulfatase [Pseudomonadota bacterium]